ncbi:hypothetical protein SEA_AMORE2_61 [Gordonia phage Amore2]|nr:hypothetical protein SEA_AMORE2_61 [Gordonia phage Amore2]
MEDTQRDYMLGPISGNNSAIPLGPAMQIGSITTERELRMLAMRCATDIYMGTGNTPGVKRSELIITVSERLLAWLKAGDEDEG